MVGRRGGVSRVVRREDRGLVWNDHWATKTNERARRRDAPEEYAKVQDRIDTLRVKQINR
jgi:hypothetical protein